VNLDHTKSKSCVYHKSKDKSKEHHTVKMKFGPISSIVLTIMVLLRPVYWQSSWICIFSTVTSHFYTMLTQSLMWKYSYLPVIFWPIYYRNIQTFSRRCNFYFWLKMATILKIPFKWPFMGILAIAPCPIFLSTLKTVIMPIFMLLTVSEQFKHISALQQSKQLQRYRDKIMNTSYSS